jgi:hypothetical protein
MLLEPCPVGFVNKITDRPEARNLACLACHSGARLTVFWKDHGSLQGLPAPPCPQSKGRGIFFMHRPYRPLHAANQTPAPATLVFPDKRASISQDCANLVSKALICCVCL